MSDTAWKHWAEQWGNEEPDEPEEPVAAEPVQLELPFPKQDTVVGVTHDVAE